MSTNPNAFSVAPGQQLSVSQYAPSSVVSPTVSSTTFAAFGLSTTVAAGSNGGEISTIASWANPSAGVLDVAATTNWPTSGTVTVAASGSTTAIVTYTGIAAGQLTGCAYVSGSPTGTVATGGAVTLTSLTQLNTGAFTAPPSGNVIVTCSTILQTNTGGDKLFLALAAHGTVTPLISDVVGWIDAQGTDPRHYMFQWYVTGLQAGTTYQFDLLGAVTSGTIVTMSIFGQSGTTPTQSSGEPFLMTVAASN